MSADEELRPDERRLTELLGVLRSEPPQPDASLTGRVLRAARWQAAVRPGLRAVGMLAGALLDGARLLAGGRGSGDR